MSSSRLPGKSLVDIGGEPSLVLLLKRLSRSGLTGEIVVATSTDPIDDQIAEAAAEAGARSVRGPRDDVLARFLIAVEDRRGPVVRITGDCPLIDPALVDATIERFSSAPGCAYATNIDPRRFPDGLDVEVIDAAVLRAVATEELSPEEREHVTLAIRTQPERFPASALIGSEDLGELRWTVDEAGDLEFVRAVVERLGERRYEAGMKEILDAVRAPPSLAGLGGHVRG